MKNLCIWYFRVPVPVLSYPDNFAFVTTEFRPRPIYNAVQAYAREKLPITVSAMDVDSDVSVRQAIAAIEEAHGAIDVLVNNAGIERSGSVEELPLADFRDQYATFVLGQVVEKL